MRSVRVQRDLPIAIGSIDSRTDCFEPRDDIGRRMTERIPATTADERYLRAPRFQQFGGR